MSQIERSWLPYSRLPGSPSAVTANRASGILTNGLTRGRRLIPHVLMLGTIAGLWQLGADQLDDPTLVVGPKAMASQLSAWVTDGTLALNAGYTIAALVIGFTIGTFIAEAVAVLLSEWPKLGRFLEPYILALSAIPNIALVPMFIVWFGIGIETKIVICALATFFVVFVSAYTGLRSTDSHLLELARILRATRWQRLWKIKLMASVPFFLAGVKAALPRALIAVVVAEFLSSNRGVGYLIVRNALLMNTAGVFAGTFVLAGLVYLLIGFTASLEASLLRWKPKERR
jgi:NitT/TauT family transport system permease protein